MINHPLALGKLKSNAGAVLYTVNTPQTIILTTLRLKNLDPEGSTTIYTPIISIFSRGVTIDLTPNVPSLRPGFTLELIHQDSKILLDQGSLILGYNSVSDKVSYLIDGQEVNVLE